MPRGSNPRQAEPAGEDRTTGAGTRRWMRLPRLGWFSAGGPIDCSWGWTSDPPAAGRRRRRSFGQDARLVPSHKGLFVRCQARRFRKSRTLALRELRNLLRRTSLRSLQAKFARVGLGLFTKPSEVQPRLHQGLGASIRILKLTCRAIQIEPRPDSSKRALVDMHQALRGSENRQIGNSRCCPI